MPPNQHDKLMAVYLEHRSALLRFLTARLRNPELAEDILQDLYIKLLHANLPEVIDNPAGFLFRMASNLALDNIRGARRAKARDQAWSDMNSEKVGSDFRADIPNADDALIAKQKLAALKNRLNSLSPKAREAFERHKFHGQSYKQVAEDMGISIGTVGKHLGKAIKHITSLNTEENNDG